MIPAAAHFVWIGEVFPWVNVLALKSAAERGDFRRLVVHHTDDLDGALWWRDACELPRVEARKIDAEALLEGVGGARLGGALVDLYRELNEPAGRANVLRAAILAREGGVYLDFDTVTLKSLARLRHAGAFCGRERIVFPEHVKRSRDARVLAGALARTTARDLLRRLPHGWAMFRSVEGIYHAAVNNAVLGAEPRHDLMLELLERMVSVPGDRKRVRYALGTHLLQAVVADYSASDLVVCEPEVFYPLGPEISEHWFRRVRRVDLSRMLHRETLVVHWYASVRTRHLAAELSPQRVRQLAQHQPFSALALPFVS